ncbi:MAG: hypothetical protein AAF713_20585 [Pseudomonadota bacterium]
MLVRVQVNGDDNVVPLFNRVEREGRQAGRRISRSLEPAERAAQRLNAEARGAAAGLGVLGASSASVNRLNASIGTLGRLVGGAAIGLALAEIVQQGRLASAELANIGDTADRLQVEPRFLQEIQEVQNLLGQRPDGLEEALFGFTRRVGEANAGSTEAVRLFQQLGVETQDAAGNARPLRDVYLDVADAIAGIDDPYQRAAAAQRLFEEGGRRLLPQLSQGREGFEELARSADVAGRIIGDDLVRQSQEASAALSNLERDAVRPLLTSLAQGFNTVVQLLERATTAREFQSIGNLARQVRELNAEIRDATPGEGFAALAAEAEGRGRRASRARSRLENIVGLTDRRDAIIRTLGERGFDALGNPIEERRAPEITPIELDLGTGGGGGGAASARDRESEAAARLAERIAEARREAELELQAIGQSESARVALTAAFERERQVRELVAAAAEDGATITQQELAVARENLAAIEALTNAQQRRRDAVEAAAEAERRANEEARDFNASLIDTGRSLAALATQTGTVTDRLRGLLSIFERLILQGLEGRGVLGGLLGGVVDSGAGLLSGLFSSAAGSAFSVAGVGGAGLSFGAADLPVFAFESGGAFDRGRVVDRPRTFGLASGRRGIMAERQPEGVFPLQRLSDGRLGVAGTAPVGSSGDTTINIFGDVGEREASRLPSLARQARSNAQGSSARMVDAGRRRGT